MYGGFLSHGGTNHPKLKQFSIKTNGFWEPPFEETTIYWFIYIYIYDYMHNILVMQYCLEYNLNRL